MDRRLFSYLLFTTLGISQALPPPMPPFAVRFEETAKTLVQWISDDPEYSMIDGTLYASGAWRLSLLSKDMRESTYYTDREEVAKNLKALGLNARVVPLDVKAPQDDQEGAQYGFGFADKNGKPVLWRFTVGQGGVTERGTGLDVVRTNGLRFLNRPKGSVAGIGSAVKIGDRINEAQVWKEVSAPPFFTAYHGALSVGQQVVEFGAGRRSWKIVSSPAEIRAGESWKLLDGSGALRSIRILNATPQSISVEQTGGDPADSARFTYDRATNVYGLRQVLMERSSHTLRIDVAPDGNFRVDLDRKSGITKGSISSSATNEWLIEFKSPDAANRMKLRSTARSDPDSIATEIVIVP